MNLLRSENEYLKSVPTESATACKQQIVLAGNMALIIFLKIF